MASCTIYIKHPEPAVCADDVRKRSEAIGVELNPLIRERPGDQFSRLILGSHNFARQRVSGRESEFRGVLDFIASTSVIVGVPVAPDRKVLASLMSDVDAILFDGHTFRNREAQDLLA